MQGDKLSLLVINDDDFDINTAWIDVLSLPDPTTDRESPAIGTWLQHIQLWGYGEVPDFDLLLIDINFDKDDLDPYYFEEDAIGGNPYGLLHALPLVGRQDFARMPFVWGIHSGDPSKFMDDPIAQFAFGLLCAIERRQNWNNWNDENRVPIHFGEMLGQLPNQSPNEAWQRLLAQYRNRVLEMCGNTISVELPSKWIPDAEAGDKEALKALWERGVELFAGRGDTKSIAIRSLFADIRDWEPDLVRERVVPWLTALQRKMVEHEEIYPQVVRIVSQCLSDTGLPEGKSLADAIRDEVGRTEDSFRFGVAVMICIWLDRYGRRQSAKVTDLLCDAGFLGKNGNPNTNTFRRWLLAYPTLMPKKPKLFVQGLVRNPLPPELQTIGAKYWHDHLQGQPGTRRKAPACLGHLD